MPASKVPSKYPSVYTDWIRDAYENNRVIPFDSTSARERFAQRFSMQNYWTAIRHVVTTPAILRTYSSLDAEAIQEIHRMIRTLTIKENKHDFGWEMGPSAILRPATFAPRGFTPAEIAIIDEDAMAAAIRAKVAERATFTTLPTGNHIDTSPVDVAPPVPMKSPEEREASRLAALAGVHRARLSAIGLNSRERAAYLAQHNIDTSGNPAPTVLPTEQPKGNDHA